MYVFKTRMPTNCKINMKSNNMETTTPTSRNMTQIKKQNYRNNCLSNIQHLLNKGRWRAQTPSPYTTNFDKFILFTTTATRTNTLYSTNNIQRLKQKMSFGFTKQHFWLALWLFVIVRNQVQTTGTFQTKDNTTSSRRLYSQLLSTNGQTNIRGDLQNMNGDDAFRPFVPKDPELMSHNAFLSSGQFRVLQPTGTDMRDALSVPRKIQLHGIDKVSKPFNTSSFPQQIATRKVNANRKIKDEKHNINKQEPIAYQNGLHYLSSTKQQPQHHEKEPHKKLKHELNLQQERKEKDTHPKNIDDVAEQNKVTAQDDLTTDLKSLEGLLIDYVLTFFEKSHYEPMPGVPIELQDKHSQVVNKTRSVRQTSATDAEVRMDLPRTLQTGRLLFLTGLKKVLWPVFMGMQVLKSLLIAMFIPALIGSFTKLLGKGITTGSAPLFIRPMEPPQELDFRDNSFVFEDEKFLAPDEGVKGPYAYNQPDTVQLQNDYTFDPASTNHQLSYSHLGMNERQHQLMQDSYMSALQSIGSASFKNSGSLSSSSSGLAAPMAKKPPPAAVNTFQQFQNVPDSSLLLSNYDPFYSPLLSRLDSVFAQLKINSDKEICREKLICLMYANPAKYAPYSNLVSAQLSRELNELRKPTSDNPDILRFFKYMRAAKDGQDGVDCEKTFDRCTEFKDFDNPAMVSTYHDINKLVQARKLTSK